MSVAITCYGGVEEIGGNKILIEDGDRRLLLDFGIAFGRQQMYFNEYLRPRAARGLLDLLALDLIPPLQGLYRDDLALPGLWERLRPHPLYRDLRRGAEGAAVDAVLFSHGHLDHNGDVSFIDPAIPVLTSRATAHIARVMQVTGQTSFERELTYTNPRTVSESGELVSDRRGCCQARSWGFVDGPLSEAARAFWSTAYGTSKTVTPAPDIDAEMMSQQLGLRWWPVDHSIPGAAGFALQTTSGWLAYTGDIRFHGQHGACTRRFAEELAALRPAILLCEGTHIEAQTTLTEGDVVDRALTLAHQAKGRLVIADFAPRNLERLFSFLVVAAQTERALLVQPKDLYLLEAIAKADPDAYLNPRALPSLALYADPKAAPRPWETALRERWQGQTRTAAHVSADPGAYILAFSLWDANDLLDMEGVDGGYYLYSNSRAYDDEQAVDLERLRHWVRRMGFLLYGDPDDGGAIRLHASGHAPGPALAEFVRTVNPRVLVPIHTENPTWWTEQLAGTGITIRPPARGERMFVS